MRIRFWNRAVAPAFVFLTGLASLSALNTAQLAAAVPENYEVRERLAEVVQAPVSERPPRPAVYPQAGWAHTVQARTESQEGHRYYLFLNGIDRSFPIASPGNYIIKRSLSTGEFVQIKVFLRGEAGSFVRLFPLKRRTVMDVYLFGQPLYRHVVLAMPLQYFISAPFSRIVALSAATVDWAALLESGPEERGEPELVARIRATLPRLPDRDDGALDARGRFVLIADGSEQQGEVGLNCSGFSKWVVDGMFFPLTGRYLEIAPLKKKHLESRGNRWSARFEEERDPYFGLDWTRNLAVSLNAAWSGVRGGPEDYDVRSVEFLRYYEDVGYPLAQLRLALFLDYRRNPGSFYLGSLNREYGKDPVLYQHFHVAVFFPYFSADGRFRVAVFERNEESSLESLQGRYPDSFVHLVRLPRGSSFVPQQPAGAAR